MSGQLVAVKHNFQSSVWVDQNVYDIGQGTGVIVEVAVAAR